MKNRPAADNTLAFQNHEDYQRMQDILQSAGYSGQNIHDHLGLKDINAVTANDRQWLIRLTDNGTPLDTFVRLFLIEAPCDPDFVARALAPMDIKTWEQAGLIRTDSHGVWAQVKLLPFQDLLLAYDLPCRLETGPNTDFVMGIGKSSLTLANLTVRNPITNALDLGTGCGIQAFLAAAHASRVCALDYNQRAVMFAEFNARLNNLPQVECISGNLFEPVRERTFDLIISNPPFVISPENKYIYRDGGMPADQLCRKIVSAVPRFMNEGAYCQILCNWIEQKNIDWRHALRQWFDGSGCDVWVMRSETQSAADYAGVWIRHTEKAEPQKFEEQLQTWLTYYEQQGIDAISAGIITMRRRSTGLSPNWFRADEAPNKMLGPCGQAIMQGFQLMDYLESTQNDETLLQTAFLYSPDLRLERRFKPTREGWTDESCLLHLSRGLTYSGDIDTFIADLIIHCNGELPLEVLMQRMARSMNLKPGDISAQLCRIVRGMVERGFILPVGKDLKASE